MPGPTVKNNALAEKKVEQKTGIFIGGEVAIVALAPLAGAAMGSEPVGILHTPGPVHGPNTRFRQKNLSATDNFVHFCAGLSHAVRKEVKDRYFLQKNAKT